MKKLQLLTLVFLIFLSCVDKSKTSNTKNENAITGKNITVDTLRVTLKNNITYISDSLVKDKTGVIKHYFNTYQTDTCGIIVYTNKELKENFEGTRIIKNIRNETKSDTIFVIQPFNNCDEGESYCFFDKSLPRLQTDSYCCQPDNLFVIEDIDEDGINEIGIYYSSCTSRYKSLKIYSLKEGNWNEIGSSDFDILTQDPTKVKFKNLVKKVAKKKFRICNFNEGKTEWKTTTMK